MNEISEYINFILILIFFFLWIFSLIHCIQNQPKGTMKSFWIAFIIIFNFIAGLFYFIFILLNKYGYKLKIDNISIKQNKKILNYTTVITILIIVIVYLSILVNKTVIEKTEVKDSKSFTTKPKIYIQKIEKSVEKIQPIIVSFPFSWEVKGKLMSGENVNGVRITVVNMKYLGDNNLDEIGLGGISASSGYCFYGISYTMKYLRHKKWDGFRAIAGLSLELKTDRDNTYKSKGLSYSYFTDFKPEEEKKIWEYFEIRKDEKPIELRNYEVLYPNAPSGKQMDIAYIWKIEK